MDDKILSIGIIEARGKCKGIVDLEQRTKAAMKEMKGHWLVQTEPEQFRCAIAATIMETTDETEKEKLAASHRNLAKLSVSMMASMNGVEVGDLNIEEKGDLPILSWWKEL